MSPVLMTHPEHGAMHVYEQADIERHQKLGWHVEQDEIVTEPKKRGRPKKVDA